MHVGSLQALDVEFATVTKMTLTNAIRGWHEFVLSIPPKMDRLRPFAITAFFSKTKKILDLRARNL
jgi:hypothetical protein